MKLLEVRLGNVIMFAGPAVIGDMLIIDERLLREFLEDSIVFEHQYCGVKLTDKLLRKFGIVEIIGGHRTFHLNERFHLAELKHLNSGVYRLETTSGFGEDITICEPIMYAHHLQNIYFALTGEELLISSLT